MNSPAARRTLFLAGLVFACSAFAGNDINKCITPAGHVTLTDEVCPSGTDTVKVVNGADDEAPATLAPARAGIERYTVARMPARYGARLRGTEPARGLALDVATLKAARAALQLFDAAPRTPRLAGLQ